MPPLAFIWIRHYWANNKVDHNFAIQNIWSKLRPVMKKEKKKEKMYFKI
jgi:hypothetical protein